MILKNWSSIERETDVHLSSLARDAELGRRDSARVLRFVGRLLRRWGERLDPPPIAHARRIVASPSPKKNTEPPTIH